MYNVRDSVVWAVSDEDAIAKDKVANARSLPGPNFGSMDKSPQVIFGTSGQYVRPPDRPPSAR